MTTDPSTAAGPTRRALFLGAGAVGAGVLLAACSGDGGDGGPGDNGGQPAPPGNGNGNQPPGGGQDSPPEALASVSEVEVGGGIVNTRANVVVTQPTAGEFRGFNATCTHAGCQVAFVRDGLITCPCHGSQYSIEDGSVVQAALGGNPANQRPLTPVEVVVDGDVIRRAD